MRRSARPRLELRLLKTLSLIVLGGCARVGVPVAATPRPEAEPPAVVDSAPAAGESRVERDGEVRGAWVIRTSLDSPDEIRAMVRDAAAAGINTLLVQVRGRADAYYRSAFEPRAERLAPGFDPLQVVLDEARPLGIDVHAWVVAHLVWGIGPLPEDPDHLVNRHPEWLAVPRALAEDAARFGGSDLEWVDRLHEWTVARDGRVEGLFVNPALPEVRAHTARVAAEIARAYDVDGIHLDYIRYASPEYDWSPASLSAFRGWLRRRAGRGEWARLERLGDGDPIQLAEAAPERFAEFRREQVTLAVSEIRAEVRRAGSAVPISAAVFADPVDARQARYQPWGEWLRQGLIEVAVPMAYTPDPVRFDRLLGAAMSARSAARGEGEGQGRVWMGLGAWQDDLDGSVAKLQRVREGRLEGAVLFSWDWARFDAPEWDGRPWLDVFRERGWLRGR